MRTILVTGGAGYIGSHIVEQLAARGDQVIILDALVYGQAWPEITGAVSCIQGECGDKTLLDQLFSEHTIDAVIHCAALIEVGVSVKEPLNFYNTNVSQTLVLLERMKAHGVNTIVFSSSAAVYGNPGVKTIAETVPCVPLNPYGQSKLFIEHVLADCAQAYRLRYAALRYFNVAGAWAAKGLGERHLPETHVVPLLLKAAADGTPFNLYSADYGTPDGTCIRDYVHVRDIARANVLALDALHSGADTFVANIGSGTGISVLDLVHVVEQVTGKTLATRVVERRSGDAARLVADARCARNMLDWQSRFTLEAMVRDAQIFYDLEYSLRGKSLHRSEKAACF